MCPREQKRYIVQSQFYYNPSVLWCRNPFGGCRNIYKACAGLAEDLTKQQGECRCRFRLSMDRTSETNLSASNIGRRFNNAVSDGSANQDLIGMALSADKIKN